MIQFTKQERAILFVFVTVVLLGSVLQYAFKTFPELKDIVNLIESKSLYPKTDINQASLEELVTIPYIGPYTASKIIEFRQTRGPFQSKQELKLVPGIREKNFERFAHYIRVSKGVIK